MNTNGFDPVEGERLVMELEDMGRRKSGVVLVTIQESKALFAALDQRRRNIGDWDWTLLPIEIRWSKTVLPEAEAQMQFQRMPIRHADNREDARGLLVAYLQSDFSVLMTKRFLAWATTMEETP